MDDLISRQAAIDLLKQMRKDGDMIPWEGKDVFARIRKLPSVQPESSEYEELDFVKEHERIPVTLTVQSEEVARDIATIIENEKDMRVILKNGQTGWIPVSEALPKDDENVIVTCLDDSGDTSFSYTTVAWHYKGIWVCENERCPFVIAWMPLPEPYKGGQDE